MKLFLTSFCAVILLLVALQLNSPISNVYFIGSRNQTLLDEQGQMPSLIQTHSKMKGAENFPRYKYAIFGNSRSLMIGRNSLGLSENQYFNFSIPGQSLRNSVMFLEWLAMKGKLPAEAVISVDNFALQLYGNGTILDPVIRLNSLFGDLSVLWGLGVPWMTQLRTVWRFIWSIWQDLKMLFSADSLFKSLKSALGIKGTSSIKYFRPDGSRMYGTNTLNIGSQKTAGIYETSQIIPELLIADLHKLQFLSTSHNVNISLYETPLHPKLELELENDLENKLRKIFINECNLRGLTCFSSKSIRKSGEFASWFDWTHPSEEAIGGWVSRNIIKATPLD